MFKPHFTVCACMFQFTAHSMHGYICLVHMQPSDPTKYRPTFKLLEVHAHRKVLGIRLQLPPAHPTQFKTVPAALQQSQSEFTIIQVDAQCFVELEAEARLILSCCCTVHDLQMCSLSAVVCKRLTRPTTATNEISPLHTVQYFSHRQYK